MYKKMLNDIDINPNEMLEVVNSIAKKWGYINPIEFSTNKNKKFMTRDPNGKIVHFGSSNNKDYIIYTFLYEMGEIEDFFRAKKRHSYLSRSSKIKGKWKNNMYSPNNLSRRILWLSPN